MKSTTTKLVSACRLLTVVGLLLIPRINSAAGLACGQTVTGATTAPTENDTYTFSGGAGQLIALSLASSLVGTYEMVADIYNPSGSLVATLKVGYQYSNYGGNATNLTLAAAGTYTILVHSQGYGSTGNYQLSLQIVTFGGCSSQPVSCGQRVANTSAYSSEMDAYSLAGSAGQAVSFSLASALVGTPAMVADIYNPSGTLLATLQVGYQYSNYGGNATNLTLPATGTYTILVHSRGYVGSGYYELSLQTFSGGGCNSRPVSCGQTLTNTSAYSSEMDAYSLAGSAGQAVSLSLASSLVGTPAMVADIYNPSGALLATLQVGYQYSNYGGNATNLTLPATGIYTILVHSQGYVGNGYYELSLQTFLGGGCGSRPISCGQTLTNTSTFSSEMDAYSLAGSAGQALSLSLSSALVGTPEMVADIYNPGGTLLATLKVGYQYSNYGGNATNLTLPAGGTYTILVHSQGYVGAGYYELSLQTFLGGGCNSTPLACGQTINAGTSHTSEMEAYGFETGGGTVILSFTGYSGARFDLYDPLGNKILTGSPGAGISTNLASGIYTFLEHDASYTGAGTYQFTVTCMGGPCNLLISPTGPISVGASGTNGVVMVTNGAGCDWTAAANANWLHITSGASGSGNGTVSYTVDANCDASQRQGMITIGGTNGWIILVNQANPVALSGQDIGAPGAPGGFTYSDCGIYTVSGSGEGTDGSADVFYFLCQPLMGDAQIVARLRNLQGGDSKLAEAGIMMRESLDPGSKQASLMVNSSTNMIFNRRLAANVVSILNGYGGTNYLRGTNYLEGTNYIWLRLMRMGNTFIAHCSTNGLDWQYLWFTTMAMSNQVQVGLALTAHHYGELTTAAFDNVSAGNPTPLSGAWPLPGPKFLLGGQNWSPAELQRVGGFECLLGGNVGDYFSIAAVTNPALPFGSWPQIATVTNALGVTPILDTQALTNKWRFYRATRLGP